ncbi:MAG: hypothetical protein PHV90_00340 [Smithella sp.]|jgi:hypothetical protein|nr:hypothetical protein [Smithella sp.]
MADTTKNIDGGTPAGEETSLSGELGDISAVVSEQLKDEFGATWPPSKVIPYWNLFIQETVGLKPDVYPVEETIILVAGARQDLPTAALLLLDAICNISGTSTVAAPVPVIINKKNLDLIYPGWQLAEGNASVSFIVRDDFNPKVFYTYPPQPSTSTGKVKLLVSEMPDAITINSTDFPFDDSYIPAAVDYLIYRCLIEETTIPNAQAKAMTFYNKYLQDLGLKASIEKKIGAKQ